VMILHLFKAHVDKMVRRIIGEAIEVLDSK
jgi:hypothetical protein